MLKKFREKYTPDVFWQKRGLTLIELVIVISIISVISYFSLPVFRPFLEYSGLKKDAWKLLSDLRWYRQLAIIEHNNYKFSFDVLADSYTIDEHDAATNAFIQTLSTVSLENDITQATDSTFRPNGEAVPSTLVTIKGNKSSDSISISVFATTGLAKMVTP
ncbi:MAG: prepilin-type N-terminal cleavage/methylation domain-containing protein [Candidatus Omnitrophica bacterium]|nr:prepilin-type N-terminal cleavage/methylation domain-containing protein [Candidatus Omnitrophota bacterium]